MSLHNVMSKTIQLPSSEELDQVLEQRFGLNQQIHFTTFEIVRRDANPNAYDRLRAEFEQSVTGHIEEARIRKRRYFGPLYAVCVEFTCPRTEIADLDVESLFYYPICTKEEIRHILRPTAAGDHLLKIRADAIAESARLQRVFLRRRELAGASWSLTAHFGTAPFDEYLESLPAERREKCRGVRAGFAYLLEPNGACIRTQHGDIIVISEVLKEYLYYMNLFLMTQDDPLPDDGTASALWIGVRSMMLAETPDFDLDPRGIPPEPLNEQCKSITRQQIQFVIGHEYAHHQLGHLGPLAKLTSKHVLSGAGVVNGQIYSRSQQQELDADAASMLDPELSDSELELRLHAASLFFFGLDIWHAVRDFTAPPIRPSTHPTARERLVRLRHAVLSVRDLDLEKVGTEEVVRKNFAHLDRIKETLRRQLPLEIESIEEYGSTYLRSFRPKALNDRVDY